MTYEAICNAIRTRFEAQITVLENVTTFWDNAPATPPDTAPWIRLAIRPGDAERTELSIKAYRIPGVAFANIFTPIQLGDKSALEFADAIVAKFRSLSADGVTYRTPSVSVVGATQGKWWQVNVQIPFEVRSVA